MVEVLRRSELVALAGSAGRARTLLRSGAWQRVLHDAYVCGGEDPADPSVRAAAARRVLPPDAALSHRSTLWLLFDDVLLRDLLDVTVPRGRHLERRPGLRTHSADLPVEELVRVDGVLAVSSARSVVDVMRSGTLCDGVAFGDRALRLGAATPALVAEAVERAAGLRGVVRARAALALLDGRSESWQESVLRVSLRLDGLDDLDVQYDAYTVDGHVGRGDLHVRGVWIEYDGRAARLEREVFEAERTRQTALLELGFELRRFTARDVPGRSPASLGAEVRRAVAMAAGRDRSRVMRGPDTLRPPRLVPLPTLAEQHLRRAA